MSKYQAWLYLQDGNSMGLSLSSIGSNLLNNSIDKIITYKSFLKLIPNPAQDISSKSKLKIVAEWTISGEYYQLYGWISGQSSKINIHNFELDDYPDQDFFGDLILFKIDLNGYKIIDISEVDIQTIDIANREDDEEVVDEEDVDAVDEVDGEYGSDDEKEKEKEADEEDEEEEEENYDYDDDDKAEDGDDALDDGDGDDVDDVDADYDDDQDIPSIKKKPASKATVCNFSRLVCDGILTEQHDKNYNINEKNEKQNKIISIFQKILFTKKTINKNDTLILNELERGIYNWTIREADKNGFMCLWDDRQFNRIYTRKAISIYQNLNSDNKKLINFVTNTTVTSNNEINAYNISFMTPNELCPEKYTEIINKLKEKEKVIFEKRVTVGSKQFKCSKCGERDVAVTTAQTRSGDEGITLFLTCNNCGKQWRMS